MAKTDNMNPVVQVSPNGLAHGAITAGLVAAMVVDTRAYRRSVLVQNLSSNDVYVGGASVTTVNGIKLAPGADITVYTQEAIYVIAGVAGCNVRYLEEYHG